MVNLKIEDLKIQYDDFVAVKNVSLNIKDKEIVTLLGPSGCGKTSILRAIAGFVKPAKGDILVDDKVITWNSPQSRNMGMIFQNYALWPHMTVSENIAYGLKLRKIPKEERIKKVKEYLKLVNLEGEGDKYPRQLSGGQQQRVALARALIIEPEILLCDEPLSNLDYNLRVELRTQIRDIAKKVGVTVVYVTHDQSEALAISDRIAVLNNGVIQQVADPITIYNDPDNLFVASFIGEHSRMDGKITQITSDYTAIKLESGEEIMALLTDKVNKDEEVTVLFRPDNLEFAPEEDDENVLEATLTHSAFMGTYIHIEATLNNNIPIIINEYDKILQAANVKPGEKFKVQIPPDEILVFNKDGQRIR